MFFVSKKKQDDLKIAKYIREQEKISNAHIIDSTLSKYSNMSDEEQQMHAKEIAADINRVLEVM